MGTQISLTASDGFKLGGYRADPAGKPKGGLVVIQEIFGVNHHVRSLCDRFAALGYASVAPAVFDRMTPNFECGYTPAEIENARTFIPTALPRRRRAQVSFHVKHFGRGQVST